MVSSHHRLASPFHLAPPQHRAASSTVETSPIASRTRSKTPSRLPRRRRIHAFDELPWIATLDAAPQFLNPWDIADLSLIAPDASLCDPLSHPTPGPGPVRRRKSSLRSSPITTITKNSSPAASPLHTQPLSTPRTRFIPSRVLFHNLMPVVDSHPCISTSHLNF